MDIFVLVVNKIMTKINWRKRCSEVEFGKLDISGTGAQDILLNSVKWLLEGGYKCGNSLRSWTIGSLCSVKAHYSLLNPPDPPYPPCSNSNY